MTELESQTLLEALIDSGRRGRIQQLGNGTWVIVTQPDGVFLWDKRDAARYRKGSLQKALERKLKKQEVNV